MTSSREGQSQAVTSALSTEDRARIATSWADRITALLLAAPNEAIVPATPPWTVHDVASHLRAAVQVYIDGPRGQASVVDDPTDLPALNERLMDPHRAESTDVLAREIGNETRTLVAEVLDEGPATPRWTFNGGETVAVDRALGLLIGEFVIHGHDIAAMTGTPWPIDADSVEVVLDGMEDVFAGFVDPARAAGHSAAYEVRVRGGRSHRWVFDDGHLSAQSTRSTRADCTISADPAALLLIMYGRLAPWRAALTGRVLAWGRRPWLGLTLADRFHAP